MNGKRFSLNRRQAGLALAATLLVTLTGCVGYVDGPRAGVYVAPPVVVMEDDYVYYPNYEIYYSSSRHQYAYRDGNGWVARPAPRGVSVNVLFASPSVRMNFHDAPANHHAEIVRQYPRNWAPAGPHHDQNRPGHPGHERGNNRDQHGK